MRKNLENTNAIVQASYQEILDLKRDLASVAAKLELVCSLVQKSTFNSNMTGCDLSEFFPVERKEQIELFMDREHPEWNDRKTEFYNFLYTIASNVNVKKGFARGIIKALFTRNYISTAKWPSFG